MSLGTCATNIRLQEKQHGGELVASRWIRELLRQEKDAQERWSSNMGLALQNVTIPT